MKFRLGNCSGGQGNLRLTSQNGKCSQWYSTIQGHSLSMGQEGEVVVGYCYSERNDYYLRHVKSKIN